MAEASTAVTTTTDVNTETNPARLSCPSFFFGRNSRKFERSSAAAALDLHSQIGMNSQVSKQRRDFDYTLQKATGTRSPEPQILKNVT